MTSIASQVDKMFEKMSTCMLSEGEMFEGSSKLVSLLFGYKLIEVAIVSLSVTVKSKGIVPKKALAVGEQPRLLEQAQQLFDYGLLDHDVYQKIIRVVNAHSDVNFELLGLNNVIPLFDNVLDDVSSILKTTETLVSEVVEEKTAYQLN